MTDNDTEKLVRDNIPSIIRDDDQIPITHNADNDEYIERLCEKLVEEAEEYRESQELEELADIAEVVLAIRKHNDISRDELERSRRRKRKEKGGFSDQIVLDEIRDE